MDPATLGVVMLETRFPRPRGDIGNPMTFGFPVRYRTVSGASPRRVVVEREPVFIERRPVVMAPAPVYMAPMAPAYSQPVDPSLNFNFTIPLR